MTSNIGSHWLSETSGDLESILPQVMEELRHTFRPEFLNRVDDIIVFQRLTPELIAGIVHLQVAALQKTLAQRDLKLDVDPAAIQMLAREGYDPVYGARPLKRLLQKKIQDRLAMMLLEGKIRPGERVRVGLDEKSRELTFSPVATAAAN
jgi:ATP-dependent Clp protease ATP-binding subunit ClpB